jgi:hypothetical protein
MLFLLCVLTAIGLMIFIFSSKPSVIVGEEFLFPKEDDLFIPQTPQIVTENGPEPFKKRRNPRTRKPA